MTTWSFTWALRNLVAELLMPPGIWIVLIVLAFICLNNYKKSQKAVVLLAVAMIWVTSTNFAAIQLTNMVDHFMHWSNPLDFSDIKSVSDVKNINSIHESDKKAQAIVILGGGRRKGAIDVPQYENQDVSASTMERLRLGSRLAKATNLPVLVTGGAPDRVSSKDIPEAQLMAQVLQHELGSPAKWIEYQSATTQENAKFSANILKKEHIHQIYLVTHFWHMPRAKGFFESEGFQVIEAPAGFYQKDLFNPLDFYPSNEGFQRNRWIWHEILGELWRRLKL